MNLLMAHPDRDFSEAFHTLLSLSGYTVTSVFDGTQVITRLAAQSYDMMIVDENIPRIPVEELLRTCRKKQMPVIVLSGRRLHAAMLSAEPLTNAYLTFPFLPQELIGLIGRVQQQHQNHEPLRFEGVEIHPADFSLCGTVPVTEGETTVFRCLLYHQPIDNKRAGPYIAALNHKLEKLQKNVRIRYLMNDGYRLVKMNE